MNKQSSDNCQKIVDDNNYGLSVTSLDWTDVVALNNDAHPASGSDMRVLDEIDAIAVTVEFAVTPSAPIGVTKATEQEALLDACLADLDLKPTRHQKLVKAWKEKHQADIEKNQRSGHIAQGLDAIDEWRKTPDGKQHLKLTRKERRHRQALEEGRTIKPRRANLTDEQRRQANAERQAKHRSSVAVADKSAERKERRKRNKAKQAAEAKALIDARTIA